MKNRAFCLLIAVSALLLPAVQADGCTTFVLRQGGSLVFGRNFDFFTGSAFVTINRRGIVKSALGAPGEKPFSWKAAYGSLTFNQVGKYFPYDGMNEAGLVVAQMWNDGTCYAPADDRPGLSELQWIQYQLDTSRSVAEVLASDEKVRIQENSAPLHFLVLDRSGDAAVIEWLEGKRAVYHGSPDLPLAVLANDPYLQDLAYAKPFIDQRKTADIPSTPGSEKRFARAAAGVLKYADGDQGPAVQGAFAILADVAQPSTRYGAVYDPLALAVHFRSEKNAAIRRIELKGFDFSCGSSEVFADIDKNVAVHADFEPFAFETNRLYLEKLIANCKPLQEMLIAIKDGVLRVWTTATCEQ